MSVHELEYTAFVPIFSFFVMFFLPIFYFLKDRVFRSWIAQFEEVHGDISASKVFLLHVFWIKNRQLSELKSVIIQER